MTTLLEGDEDHNDGLDELEEEEDELDEGDDELDEGECNLSYWLQQNHSTSCSLSLDFSIADSSFEVEASTHVDNDYYLEDDIQILTKALQGNTNTSIVGLCLDGDWSGMELAPSAHEQFMTLLESLVDSSPNCSSLKRLIIGSSRGSAKILNYLIQQAENLEKIEFYDVRLEGSQVEFEELADALRTHQCLKEMNSCFLEIPISGDNNNADADQAASKCILDKLLQAILQAPSMEYLDIVNYPLKDYNTFSTSTLMQACSSPTLTQLHLTGVFSEANLQENAVTKMMQALEHNKVLRCLRLGLDLNITTSAALTKLIHRNQTLDSIHIDQNTMQQPETFRRHQLEQSLMIDLAHALANNQTLTKFQLIGELNNQAQLDDDVVHAYASMLSQSNYTLQKLVLLDWEDEEQQRETIDFYLKLNRKNRQERLCQVYNNNNNNNNNNNTWWLESLERLANDKEDDLGSTALSTLYYYLSQNPSLISALH